MSRYDNRIEFRNSIDVYREKLRERGVKSIRHYNLGSLRHPSVEQIRSLDLIDHVWSFGDKYFKLAHKYYGDSELWWIIAWFNERPTESHLELGDIIQIPLPLDRVVGYLGV